MNTLSSSQPQPTETRAGRPLQPPPLPWEALDAQLEIAPPQPPERPKRTMNAAKQVRLLFWIISLSALSYYITSRYVVTAVVVQGKSMLPTLHDGDRFLLNRWALQFRNPERGDLVVIRDPGHSDFAVKRIVGLPLDTVLLKDGNVYLNGKLYTEPYLRDGTRTYSPGTDENFIMVGKNRYFVLGDNRSVSEDSRFYGSIRKNQIVGVIEE